jgi:hypothetical protein
MPDAPTTLHWNDIDRLGRWSLSPDASIPTGSTAAAPSGPPMGPGVFVLYRDGRRVLVVRSASLAAGFAQLRSRHPNTRQSTARRMAAEFLGIAPAAVVLAGRYRPTGEDEARISRWLAACEVTWVACATESLAVELESRLRREAPARVA